MTKTTAKLQVKQQLGRNINENRIEQCFATHTQQYYSSLLNPWPIQTQQYFSALLNQIQTQQYCSALLNQIRTQPSIVTPDSSA